MAADTCAKGPLWDPDPDKPSLPFIILNTSYSHPFHHQSTFFVCMHARYLLQTMSSDQKPYFQTKFIYGVFILTCSHANIVH